MSVKPSSSTEKLKYYMIKNIKISKKVIKSKIFARKFLK